VPGHNGEDFATAYLIGHAGDIRAKCSVLLRDGNATAHEVINRFRNGRGLVDVEKVQGLAGNQQFDGQNRLKLLRNLLGLDGRIIGKAHRVFLITASRDAVDGGGEREHLHLTKQAGRLSLSVHSSIIKLAGIIL
jgi:hypothetical protein